MDVVVDIEAHCLPVVTTLDGAGATWEWGPPSLVILVHSNCFSSATLWASYGANLGGLASLWL